MILFLDEFLWNLLGIICWLIFFKECDEMLIIVVCLLVSLIKNC